MTQSPRPRTWLACGTCGGERAETHPTAGCDCGGLLDVRHRAPEEPAPELRSRFESRWAARSGPLRSGVWRFRELVLPTARDDELVTHPEGNTPLLRRPVLSRWAGHEDLAFKHEGHNPTGSFKDRGMTVGVTQAKRIGARAVACASTGNTAASLAAYAAAAELPAVVLVPAGRVARGKLAQSLAYGARTLMVRADFDACLRLLQTAADRLGVYLLNSVNPFRIEGQKSIIFELLEQVEWNPPDWIVLPAGNLGNTAAFGKALAEARAAGLISRIPRLAAVQAAGAAPFAQGFTEGFRTRRRVSAETVATAIRIGDPASWDRAVEAIRFTDGVVTAVADDEILDAKGAIDGAGVGCEPASAASLAGLRRLVADGVVARADRVVAVLTGHLLKEPDPSPSAANRPMEIEPTLEALAQAIGPPARA